MNYNSHWSYMPTCVSQNQVIPPPLDTILACVYFTGINLDICKFLRLFCCEVNLALLLRENNMPYQYLSDPHPMHTPLNTASHKMRLQPLLSLPFCHRSSHPSFSVRRPLILLYSKQGKNRNSTTTESAVSQHLPLYAPQPMMTLTA